MDTRHICCWMGRRSTKELHKLVMMMATCLRTLLWSFMLCFVVMTVWAMLMVETIHPSLEEMYLADELGSCDTQCIRSMSSVMDANLLIFKTVIAGDSWGEIAVPVIQKHPGTAIIFVGSLLTLVFGVLNLIVPRPRLVKRFLFLHVVRAKILCMSVSRTGGLSFEHVFCQSQSRDLKNM